MMVRELMHSHTHTHTPIVVSINFARNRKPRAIASRGHGCLNIIAIECIGSGQAGGWKRTNIKNLKPQRLANRQSRQIIRFVCVCVCGIVFGVKSFTKESDELVPKHQISLVSVCTFRHSQWYLATIKTWLDCI